MIFVVILATALVATIVVPMNRAGWLTGWRGTLFRPVVRLVARPTREMISRLPSPRRHHPPDPFEALRVQTRLSAVAEEIRALHYDDAAFARAARLEARAAAYDALLREACEMAGVDDLEESPGRATMRMRRELELAQRGWSW